MQVLITWIVDFGGDFTELYCCRDNWWFIKKFDGVITQITEAEARQIIENSKFKTP